jgi:hypothetical protein
MKNHSVQELDRSIRSISQVILQQLGPFQNPADGVVDLGQRRVGRCSSGDEKTIPAIGDAHTPPSDSLAQQALGSISSRGLANLSAGGKAESADSRPVCPDNQNQKRVMESPAMLAQ